MSDYTAYDGVDGSSGYMVPRYELGSAGTVFLKFPAATPLDFNQPGAEISFTIILDKEASNPDGHAGATGNIQELPDPIMVVTPQPSPLPKQMSMPTMSG